MKATKSSAELVARPDAALNSQAANPQALGRQRIDKWLWHARVVRTRSQASALANSGHVRLNGERVDAARRPVRAGDVITVALDRTVRLLKVLAFADRRGSAVHGRALYDDLSPPPPPSANPRPAQREPGAGRPTKRERRAIDRLRDGNELE